MGSNKRVVSGINPELFNKFDKIRQDLFDTTTKIKSITILENKEHGLVGKANIRCLKALNKEQYGLVHRYNEIVKDIYSNAGVRSSEQDNYTVDMTNRNVVRRLSDNNDYDSVLREVKETDEGSKKVKAEQDFLKQKLRFLKNLRDLVSDNR